MSLLIKILIFLEIVAGHNKTTFTKRYSKNTPIKEDPFYGHELGDLDNYVKVLGETKEQGLLKINDWKGESKSSIGSLEEAQYYVNFAGAAYCSDPSLIAWTCKHCGKLGGNIQLDTIIDDTKCDTRLVIAIDNHRKEILLAFRGSNDARTWLQNLKFDKTGFNGVPRAQVHLAFKACTDLLQPRFNLAASRLLNSEKLANHKVIVTGHSFGGAIAVLASISLQQTHQVPWDRMAVYTYGQPRIGNLAFANWINRLPLSLTRVVNENDLVPHVPPIFADYVHQSTEMYISATNGTKSCNTKTPEDPSCSYSRIPFVSLDNHRKVWNTAMGSEGC